MFLDCIKSQGSLVKIKTNTNLCGYGCLGSYECPRGYDMLQSASIMCLENATWNVTDKDCVFDSASKLALFLTEWLFVFFVFLHVYIILRPCLFT